ncbi:MAG: cation:proton antiporter [Candidatus Dormibacteraeota bacterium]|nr:cation:proton antiporter [Candidatus Dormibacteraeota bacterium]
MDSRLTVFVLALMATSVIALLARALPVPYESALALAGLGAGILVGPLDTGFAHSLILSVLLPGLLFDASYRLSWKLLRGNLVAVVLLATMGVLLTTTVVAFLGHLALGLALPLAILLGAMVAPTDPVAVVAVFRRLSVPDRLLNLIEGESLANDGTGVVVFTIALTALGATALQPGPSLVQFVRLALGGVALGVAVGFLLSALTSRVDDFQVEITLTAIAAYGGYLLGTYLQVSGILTVVSAGVVLGSFGRPRGMSQRTQEAIDQFWDYAAFILNSFAFLLIGLTEPWRSVLDHAGFVALAAVIALLARAVSVYAIFGLLRPLRLHVSFRWQHLLVWGGLRGVIAVVLVLSLTGSGGSVGLVRSLVYGVTLLSIVVQGATVGPVARALLRQPKAGGEAATS